MWPSGVDESDMSGEALVVTVTDTLRDAVVAADAPTLAAVAAAWAEAEDMRGVSAAVQGEFLTLFAELAKAAVDRGARLCGWWALSGPRGGSGQVAGPGGSSVAAQSGRGSVVSAQACGGAVRGPRIPPTMAHVVSTSPPAAAVAHRASAKSSG